MRGCEGSHSPFALVPVEELWWKQSFLPETQGPIGTWRSNWIRHIHGRTERVTVWVEDWLGGTLLADESADAGKRWHPLSPTPAPPKQAALGVEPLTSSAGWRVVRQPGEGVTRVHLIGGSWVAVGTSPLP
jgi:hypothetical protein